MKLEEKSEYSPTEVANLMGIHQTTVIRWIEQAKLNSFRTPGGHYRITTNALRRFYKEYKFAAPPSLTQLLLPEVLVVDDDPEVLKMLVKALTGHLKDTAKVVPVGDGLEALIQVGRSIPDVAVVDVVMEGADGFKVCEKIRAAGGGYQTHLILITGQETPQKKNRAEALDAALLTKPLDLTELKGLVSAALADPAAEPKAEWQ